MSVKKSFVVKNGLEVADNLIFTESQKVGIGTTQPDYTLSVNGDLSITGSLFVPTEDVGVKTSVGIVSDTSISTITGINTTSLLVGDYITGSYIQDNTRITGIGSSSLSILPNHTNTSGLTTTSFTFLRYEFSGLDGQALVSQGPGLPPTWIEQNAFSVGLATTAINVIGGIASVTQLYVSPGISTFVGIITATDAYFSGLVSIDTLDVDGATTLNDKTTITGNSDSLLNIDHDGSGNALQINNYKFSVKTGSFNASSGVSTVVDSYSLLNDEYDTMEYTLNIINGDNIQAQKVLVLQNTTNVYCSEYGILFNNKPIVSIGVSIVNSSYELKLTPESGISGLTTYKFIRGGIVQ